MLGTTLVGKFMNSEVQLAADLVSNLYEWLFSYAERFAKRTLLQRSMLELPTTWMPAKGHSTQASMSLSNNSLLNLWSPISTESPSPQTWTFWTCYWSIGTTSRSTPWSSSSYWASTTITICTPSKLRRIAHPSLNSCWTLSERGFWRATGRRSYLWSTRLLKRRGT